VDAVAQGLADPIRREILRMLRDRTLTAGAIAGSFQVSRPAVSRHLRVLREAGLVADTLVGRERVYRLELSALAELEAFLGELYRTAAETWERRFLALETEVHRVGKTRRAGKAATPLTTDKPKPKKEKESA
jgi:DNA-binding transcriptional ArsR family regulator